MTLAGEFGYGRPNSTFNNVDLVSFSNWHTSNASSFTTAIPNFYFYQFDGSISTINDGGYNMFNIGNYLTLSGIVNAPTIPYGTLVNQGRYGYFVSQPNVWPQVELAWTPDGTITWTNAGAPGTAGTIGSSNANFSGSYTTTNRGRFGSYWVNQTYGKLNPTICYVWFTILQPSLNGVINSVVDGRNTVSPPYPTYTQYFSVLGKNIIFCQMLLSGLDLGNYPNGFLIADSDINTLVTNYVQNALINIF